MAFYFLSRNETYRVGVIASGTDFNSNPVGNAIDYKFDSFWENNDVTPIIKIDLGANKTIDSFWMQEDNIATYTLEHSSDDVSYSPVLSTQATDASGFTYVITFAKQTSRYWRLTINSKTVGGNTVKLYEIQLMELKLNLATAEDRPTRFTKTKRDYFNGSYRLANADLVVYGGLSERGKSDIDIEMTYVTDANHIILETLWKGPPTHPIFTLFPEPTRFRSEIFQVHWLNGFDFQYAGQSTTFGYSGIIQAKEI